MESWLKGESGMDSYIKMHVFYSQDDDSSLNMVGFILNVMRFILNVMRFILNRSVVGTIFCVLLLLWLMGLV